MELPCKFVVELVYLNGLYMKLSCFLYLTTLGMDTVFHWGMFHLPSIVKQRHVHLPFKQLIRLAIWESVQLPQPTQYRIDAGVMVGAKISLP